MTKTIVLFLTCFFAATGIMPLAAPIEVKSAGHELSPHVCADSDCQDCNQLSEHEQTIKQHPPLVPGPLTLEQALDLARENSPALLAAQMEEDAASQEIHQAGVWANPEIEFEAEGVGGDMSGTAAAEYTLAISQEFSLSGKPGKKREMARYAARAAEFSTIEMELELEIAVRKAFIETLAQWEINLERVEQERLAREFSDTARMRHKAGGASELELLEADVALEEISLKKARSEQALAAAGKELALLIGLPDPGKLQGNFFHTLGQPGRIGVVDSHPTLRRFQVLEKQAGAEVVFEKADRIPDLTLGGGIRYINEEDIHTFVLGASIPLPLFNSNQSCCDAAKLRAQAAAAETRAVRRDLEREMTATATVFETAAAEAEHFRERLLPKARRAYEVCQEGYAAGRYSWMELIQTQQALAETNIRYIEAQRDAQFALAELNKYFIGEEE